MAFRKKLLALLGSFPVKPALHPVVVDVEDCGSFTRQRVEFNVESDERIAAYVLVPNGARLNYPAIYCHHQHAGNYDLGKSEVVGLSGDFSQVYARELAERGYITFAPDALGFEERNWGGKHGDAVYFELATRLVQGKTLLAKVLHDISVGIDYLCTRSDVDRDRIGFIGHSYGGRMAVWAAAFDDRIRVSVSNCGCVRYADSLNRDAGIQLEVCVPGIMKWGDLDEVIPMIAPRSVLISATEEDKWSRGAQTLFESVKPAFPSGSIELLSYPGGHVFTREMRQAAYAFLDRQLRNPDSGRRSGDP